MNAKKLGELKITIGNKSKIGSSLAGYIKVAYAKLVDLLGQPNAGNDGYKTDAEWELTINGKVLTIYNYKDGVNYNGEEDGIPLASITDWHIGAGEDITTEARLLAKELGSTYQKA